MRKEIYLLAIIPAILISCSNKATIDPTETSSEFSVLSYNVAGLPQGVSSSNPEKNTLLMSPLLNKYDIVLVQEDFVFHDDLKSKAQHPFQSESNNGPGQFDFGDGLNRFSGFPFISFRRQQWTACSDNNGNDCLAKKGFSAGRTQLTSGVEIDIYNLHMDSGGTQDDWTARNSQVGQLLAEINSRSAGRAVIVAGDVNLNIANRPEDAQILQTLLDGAGLTDACQALSCGIDLVDRILFRSRHSLNLQAISWKIDSEFVDEQGAALSDHNAVGVNFKWQVQ